MQHHVILTVEGEKVGDVVQAIAPLMGSISGLHIEQVIPAQGARRLALPFDLGHSKIAVAVLRIVRGRPEMPWRVEEIGLGMADHGLSATSASAACSLLTANGFLTRRGTELRLTEKGRGADV